MDSARSIEIDRSVVQDMMSCSVATMRRKLFLVGREDRQPCSQLQMLYTVYLHFQDFPPTTNISWTGEHMGEMVNQDHYIGQRLSLKSQTCTVRFIGAVKDKQGQWLGVEWDDASRGKHDGTHEGISYFTCMCHAQIPLSSGTQTLMLTLRQKLFANRSIFSTAKPSMGRNTHLPPSVEGQVHLSRRCQQR